MEALEQGESPEDERGPQDDRSENAPEEDLVLEEGRNAEVIEDEDKNKNVVDTQRLLDEESGEEFQRGLRAALVEKENARAEEERETGPRTVEDEGLARVEHARFALQDPEVQREQGEDEENKSAPKQQIDVHAVLKPRASDHLVRSRSPPLGCRRDPQRIRATARISG